MARPAVKGFERTAQNECPTGFQRLLFLSIVDPKSYNHHKSGGFLLNLMGVTRSVGTIETDHDSH
jgi:hypothetical protein